MSVLAATLNFDFFGQSFLLYIYHLLSAYFKHLVGAWLPPEIYKLHAFAQLYHLE